MIYTELMIPFDKYIFTKIQEFEKEQGKRVSLDKFAEYLGVSRPLISHWLSGRTKPSLENVRILAEKFGPEIYDILELSRPDPDLLAITKVWYQIPEKSRRAIREQAEALVEGKEENNNYDRQTSKPAL